MSVGRRRPTTGRLESKSSQSEFFCEFLTQKELDPDFLDFNSVNRRYHFPARFYIPFRGVFGQGDRILRVVSGFVNPYIYAQSQPLEFADPTGNHGIVMGTDGKKVPITEHLGMLFKPEEKSDRCKCGTAKILSVLDASTSASYKATGANFFKKILPGENRRKEFVGVFVKFEWVVDTADCCCRNTHWTQKVLGEWYQGYRWVGDDPTSPKHRGSTEGEGSFLIDQPGHNFGGRLGVDFDYFRTRLICDDPDQYGKELYYVLWYVRIDNARFWGQPSIEWGLTGVCLE